jgi:hypothetical protein
MIRFNSFGQAKIAAEAARQEAERVAERAFRRAVEEHDRAIAGALGALTHRSAATVQEITDLLAPLVSRAREQHDAALAAAEADYQERVRVADLLDNNIADGHPAEVLRWLEVG